MRNRAIYENLDTSFVNLSALIKYLRRRQFVGQVRIELSGYEADVYLTTENELRVRENDHIAGRIAEGQEALQRILIRSREPDGIINVYQTVNETEVVLEKVEKKQPIAAQVANPRFQNQSSISEIKRINSNRQTKVGFQVSGRSQSSADAPPKPNEIPVAPKSELPNLPFEFTNKVEAKAKQPSLSTEDRQLIVNLAGELLATVDRSLAMAKLDFTTAFQKARTEISADYPFLISLNYQKEKIYFDGRANPKFLIAGILEALRRILDKLGASPKFGEVYRDATQGILALIHQRRPLYDRFSITKPLEKILGV